MKNDHAVDTNKMVPLTLEQLREMDGKPVWVTPTGFWALVIAKKGKRVELICNDGETVWADKYIELVGDVYAYPPAHIDREAWTGCNCNKDVKSCCTCISLLCHKCKDHSQHRIGKYCSKCGRPLTEKAWEELEKRLGVMV